jgi:hypothetical protein
MLCRLAAVHSSRTREFYWRWGRETLVVQQVGHDPVRALRQVHAVPADALVGPRAHRRARRAAHPVHVEVVRAGAGAAARPGQRPLVEPRLAGVPQHPHVRVEVVGVGDRGARVRPAQLPDALLQQHVVHLGEQVQRREAAVAVVGRRVLLVHRGHVARHAPQREVARDHQPRRAHVEELPGRARHGPHHVGDERRRLDHAGRHAPEVVEVALAVACRPVRREGVVVVVAADLAHHDQRAGQLLAGLLRGPGVGVHEVLELLQLDGQGAVGVGDRDPSPRERRRVEGRGAGDGEVDAVREVGALVEVRVEQRQAEILSEEVYHEVPVGASSRGAADGGTVGRSRGVLQHAAGAFAEQVAGVRQGVAEVVDGRDAVHHRRLPFRCRLGSMLRLRPCVARADDEEQSHERGEQDASHGRHRAATAFGRLSLRCGED